MRPRGSSCPARGDGAHGAVDAVAPLRADFFAGEADVPAVIKTDDRSRLERSPPPTSAVPRYRFEHFKFFGVREIAIESLRPFQSGLLEVAVEILRGASLLKVFQSSFDGVDAAIFRSTTVSCGVNTMPSLRAGARTTPAATIGPACSRYLAAARSARRWC